MIISNITGKGLTGLVSGERILVGSPKFLNDSGVHLTADLKDLLSQRQKEGKTTILVAKKGELLGFISIADLVKHDAIDAKKILHTMNISSMMITGDNIQTAEAIGGQVGISDIRAGILPEGKGNEVSQLQKKGEVVAFVGDGINDAPALAQSDVGIAIGSGTDIAIERADIILVKGDLKDAVAVVQLVRKVMSRIRLNLFWAFAYNIVLIPLAAGLLYSSVGILFRPEYGAFAMALSSITVVSLSLMLKRYVPPIKRESRHIA